MEGCGARSRSARSGSRGSGAGWRIFHRGCRRFGPRLGGGLRLRAGVSVASAPPGSPGDSVRGLRSLRTQGGGEADRHPGRLDALFAGLRRGSIAGLGGFGRPVSRLRSGPGGNFFRRQFPGLGSYSSSPGLFRLARPFAGGRSLGLRGGGRLRFRCHCGRCRSRLFGFFFGRWRLRFSGGFHFRVLRLPAFFGLFRLCCFRFGACFQRFLPTDAVFKRLHALQDLFGSFLGCFFRLLLGQRGRRLAFGGLFLATAVLGKRLAGQENQLFRCRLFGDLLRCGPAFSGCLLERGELGLGQPAPALAPAARSPRAALGTVARLRSRRRFQRRSRRRRSFGYGRLAPAAAVPGAAVLRHLVELVGVFFEEIRDVEEAVALQAQVDEGRLHARQHAGDAPLVDTARQRVFVGALEVDLDQLAIFENGRFGFVAVLCDHQLFGWHCLLPPLQRREQLEGREEGSDVPASPGGKGRFDRGCAPDRVLPVQETFHIPPQARCGRRHGAPGPNALNRREA
jgi:hypothetical protein